MKAKQKNNTLDLFENYCTFQLSNVKSNKDYDYCVDEFAKTELFDFSKTKWDFIKKYTDLGTEGELYVKYYDDISLPFERQFVKLANETGMIVCVFIGEFKPKVITGAVANFLTGIELDVIGFVIHENGRVELNIDVSGMSDEMARTTYMHVAGSIDFVLTGLSQLNKHLVVEDKPTGKTRYYRKKNKEVVKVVDRPIYYVLNKKYRNTYTTVIKNPIGRMSCTHAFRVRGHWRTFEGKTLGKNREGKRVVEGFTWVKEHVRGEGELKKKLRIVVR